MDDADLTTTILLATTGGICQVGPLDNNDIMTAYLASRAGYTGVMPMAISCAK
jgi:hypothetical protein